MKLKTTTVEAIIQNEVKAMTPLDTQQLFDDLYIIQDGFANVFLIKDKQQYIAIDAGIDAQRIKRELDTLGISADDVKTVLLTHTDLDHVYGINAFSHAQIYMSAAEASMLNNFRITMTEADLLAVEQTAPAQSSGMFGDLEYWPADDVAVLGDTPQRRIAFLKNTLAKPFKTLADGERLQFQQTSVEAILIAGHTKGLTSYNVNNRYLFVGDGLSLQQGRVAPFNRFLNLDEKKHRESITKLKAMTNYNYLFTQHYGYTGDIKKAFERWQG